MFSFVSLSSLEMEMRGQASASTAGVWWGGRTDELLPLECCLRCSSKAWQLCHTEIKGSPGQAY